MEPSPLTIRHRSELELVASTVGNDVAQILRSVDLEDIDGWWQANTRTLEQIVAAGHQSSAGLSANYLTAHAAEAGHALSPVQATVNSTQIREGLRVAGPVAFKQNLAKHKDVAGAARMMIARATRSAQRLSINGSRETTMNTVADSRIIIGYRRVAQPGACDFCVMLARRGGVYSAATAGEAGAGRRRRGSQRAGRSYHDSCRCIPEPVYAPTRAELARAEARQGNADRRARIEESRLAAQQARMASQQATATAGGQVDPNVLAAWGVTEEQLVAARATVKAVRRDIRQIAAKEADELGGWLSDRDLGVMSRPARARQTTDVVTGARRSVRDQSGYDWLELLAPEERARVAKRWTNSDQFAPDVVAEQVRRVTNREMTDGEAMDWLVDRWLHEDGLRSLASGRVPKYADADNLIPADYGLEGYRVEALFGNNLDDAAGHVASIQAEQARIYAERTLGRPTNGPAPWQMDASDYVRELEDITEVLDNTQLAAGVDPGNAYRQAQARIRELAPPELDTDGSMNPLELFETIRLTAQTAGLL